MQRWPTEGGLGTAVANTVPGNRFDKRSNFLSHAPAHICDWNGTNQNAADAQIKLKLENSDCTMSLTNHAHACMWPKAFCIASGVAATKSPKTLCRARSLG